MASDRGGGIYPVTVITSPAGEANGEFVLRMPGDELQAALGRRRAFALYYTLVPYEKTKGRL